MKISLLLAVLSLGLLLIVGAHAQQAAGTFTTYVAGKPVAVGRFTIMSSTTSPRG